MIILPHTSRGQFLQELEPEHEFMQELELGQELGLAKDLQEGSEELSKVDPLKSLDNSKIKCEVIKDMFEPKLEAEENVKSICKGSNKDKTNEKDIIISENKRSLRKVKQILEDFFWSERQEHTAFAA